jgi:hypothetical protein
MSKYAIDLLKAKRAGLKQQVAKDIESLESTRLPQFIPMLKSSIQEARLHIDEIDKALIKLEE